MELNASGRVLPSNVALGTNPVNSAFETLRIAGGRTSRRSTSMKKKCMRKMKMRKMKTLKMKKGGVKEEKEEKKAFKSMGTLGTMKKMGTLKRSEKVLDLASLSGEKPKLLKKDKPEEMDDLTGLFGDTRVSSPHK